jgi:hypothetical protein
MSNCEQMRPNPKDPRSQPIRAADALAWPENSRRFCYRIHRLDVFDTSMGKRLPEPTRTRPAGPPAHPGAFAPFRRLAPVPFVPFRRPAPVPSHRAGDFLVKCFRLGRISSHPARPAGDFGIEYIAWLYSIPIGSGCEGPRVSPVLPGLRLREADSPLSCDGSGPALVSACRHRRNNPQSLTRCSSASPDNAKEFSDEH